MPGGIVVNVVYERQLRGLPHAHVATNGDQEEDGATTTTEDAR